ncbi:sodium:solute symporter family protein [Acidianus manzaensis]|uniref:Sodium:solute symporter n=1 Tax=Acidianus manzaensis TaxID=282676 RepID=A0A1W6K3I3_9CREN|nr:sodium:solute symporter [Acidianus manzaensis]ARM77002.1 sodium:solute symporter [Acidianus manzaensis]
MIAIPKSNIDDATLAVFLVLFAVFIFLGFYGARWRKGDLNKLHEWGLAGRRLGVFTVWFLMGADLYTAYTFIAVPAALFGVGSLYFFAVPYVAWAFGIALLTMPRLWTVSRNKGYVTAADFVKDRFDSRMLAIIVALVGIVAELPYIALQIVGMKASLTMLLLGLGIGTSSASSLTLINEVSLVIAFIILAAFTYTSGLRGATLTGIFKDALIWLTVIVTIVAVPIAIGGFHVAFSDIPASKAPLFSSLPSKEIPAFFSLALGSSIALYLYPHAINGSLSSNSKKQLKMSTSLLPIYGIGLVFLALIGILVYAVSPALSAITAISPYIGKSAATDLVVPATIAYELPGWFVGIALVGVFIGGLVPAAIMAIAISNLFVRNIVKEFKPLGEKTESTLAKWMSAVFKFLALGFIFAVPGYAITLQLLGGIIVAQAMPPIFLGLFTHKLEKYSLSAGLLAGVFSGVGLFFYSKESVFMATPIGSIYIALISLAINLIIAGVGTGIAYALGWRPKAKIKEEEITKSL